jgi:HlyD family secretion protein
MGIRTLSRLVAALPLVAPILVGCSGGHAEPHTGGAVAAAPRDLVVRRGEFRDRFLLTGELDAVKADDIVAPRTSTWIIAIRWMEKDGAEVKAGQKVLEFDNTAFASDLEEKKLSLVQAESDLERAGADARAQEQDRAYALEERRVTLEKARMEAAVPEELQDRRKYQDRQLALHRAETEHAKAEEDLESQLATSRADLDNRRIVVEKAKREIRTAETAIQALSLAAPRDGILVVAENPWEDRKFEVGDTAYAGLAVMRIPDLAAMRVEAKLSDVDDGRVAVGMPATCYLDMYPGTAFPGKVVELTPVAQEPTRRSMRRAFRVLVDLEKTDPARMRPGMSVRVEVEKARLADALVAPRAGLDLEVSPPRAHLERGGDAEVKLGACNATDCVVLGGLEEGTRLRGPA